MGKGYTKYNRCGGMMICEEIYYETGYFWVWKCFVESIFPKKLVRETDPGYGLLYSQENGLRGEDERGAAYRLEIPLSCLNRPVCPQGRSINTL